MKSFDTINVIPFIDIMLVLLAMVLTTATFVSNNELDIKLPKSSGNPISDDVSATEIALGKNGMYYLEGSQISLAKLRQYLSTVPIETPILLLIDETVAFAEFVILADLLNTQQLNQVSVLTRPVN
jgi:biopolymer transport protein ExbD